MFALDDCACFASFGDQIYATVPPKSTSFLHSVPLSAEYLAYEDFELAPRLSSECSEIACVVDCCSSVPLAFASKQRKSRADECSYDEPQHKASRAVIEVEHGRGQHSEDRRSKPEGENEDPPPSANGDFLDIVVQLLGDPR
jgi:hypothetical protein